MGYRVRFWGVGTTATLHGSNKSNSGTYLPHALIATICELRRCYSDFSSQCQYVVPRLMSTDATALPPRSHFWPGATADTAQAARVLCHDRPRPSAVGIGEVCIVRRASTKTTRRLNCMTCHMRPQLLLHNIILNCCLSHAAVTRTISKHGQHTFSRISRAFSQYRGSETS